MADHFFGQREPVKALRPDEQIRLVQDHLLQCECTDPVKSKVIGQVPGTSGSQDVMAQGSRAHGKPVRHEEGRKWRIFLHRRQALQLGIQIRRKRPCLVLLPQQRAHAPDVVRDFPQRLRDRKLDDLDPDGPQEGNQRRIGVSPGNHYVRVLQRDHFSLAVVLGKLCGVFRHG